MRWYLSYPLSYRQVAEMVNERGMDVHHTTISRWVQQYAPELDKRCPSGNASLRLRLTQSPTKVEKGAVRERVKFIAEIFGVVA